MGMQHFQITPPSAQQRLLYGSGGGAPLFLQSAEGVDWYEAQKHFSPEKVKIAYDHDGVIRAIARDVSQLWPNGLSVADVDALPPDCSNAGNWRYYAGEVTPNPVWFVQRAQQQKATLLHQVRQAMLPIITASALNTLTAQQREHLLQLQAFEHAVSTIDITEETAIGLIFPQWPEEVINA